MSEGAEYSDRPDDAEGLGDRIVVIYDPDLGAIAAIVDVEGEVIAVG